MGGIIGAGIFFSPASVADAQPSLAGIVSTWTVGGGLTLAGAFVFAELGARYPRTGGQYVFLREAFGAPLAFLFGWCLLVVVVSAAIAVIATVCADHVDIVLREVLGGASDSRFLPPAAKTAVSVALIVGFAAINVRGVKLGAVFHNWLMVLKVLGIVFVTALGAAWLLGESGRSGWESAGGTPQFSSFGPALLGALFSYGGGQAIAAIAGEIRGASRVLPRAIVLGTSLVIALYLALNVALVAILGIDDLRATSTPVADAAGRVIGRTGHVLVALIVAISSAGVVHAYLLLVPRVYYSMAEDGVFFRVFHRAHSRFATPHVAIVLQAGIALLYVALASTFPSINLWSLLESVVFVDWGFFVLVGVAYFRLCRNRSPDADVYRSPASPVPAVVFVVVSFAVVVTSLAKASAGALLPPVVALGLGLVVIAGRWLARR